MPEDSSLEMRIEFPDEGITGSLLCTSLGNNLFRVDSVPFLLSSIRYKDVIEAEPSSHGSLRFLRVAVASRWRTFDYILSRERFESKSVQLLFRDLESHGVHCELMCGGMLFICVPPASDLDPTPWVASLGDPPATPVRTVLNMQSTCAPGPHASSSSLFQGH